MEFYSLNFRLVYQRKSVILPADKNAKDYLNIICKQAILGNFPGSVNISKKTDKLMFIISAYPFYFLSLSYF